MLIFAVMKKIILLLLCWIPMLTVFSQKVQKEVYGSGKIKSEHTIVNAQFQGPYKNYYDTGILQESGNYKNGMLNGESKLFSKKGKLKETITYKDALKHGWRIFYKEETGQPFMKYYYENNKLLRKVELTANGKTKRECFIMKLYANENMFDGVCANYYDNGIRKKEFFRTVNDSYLTDDQMEARREWDDKGLVTFYNSKKLSELNELDCIGISWDLILDKQYSDAITYARKGLAKCNNEKNKVGLKKNLALAFLFVNKTDSAIILFSEIYLNEGTNWNYKFDLIGTQLNQDFDIFKERSLVIPNLDKVKDELKPYELKRAAAEENRKAQQEKTKQLSEWLEKNENKIKGKKTTVDSLYTGSKKMKIYERAMSVYYDWNYEVNNSNDIAKKVDYTGNMIKLLDKLITLYNEDTKEIEKSLKKETDLERIKSVLGL